MSSPNFRPRHSFSKRPAATPLRGLRHIALLAAVISAGFAASRPPGPVQQMASLVVNEAPSVADKNQLPQVTESVTALRLEETVNVLDAPDAVKYLPSIFLRKRNAGDTQAIMASRTWGVSSSARSLVYADGVLLTALIANNNNIGGPRWGMVAPAEIERVDLVYGPFAAAYPGNSMGVVMEITTRQPEKLEASLSQTFASQSFAQYGTKDTYRTWQTAVAAGNRVDKFSFWVSANYQDSHSQPLGYVTTPSFPAGATGGYAGRNKLGAPAQVVGATGLLHTRMTNAKLKTAYDLTPGLRASYTLGVWRNEGSSTVETYLRNNAGAPTFAGLAAFAAGNYELTQTHSSHSVSIRSEGRGPFDLEAIATVYRMNTDRQRSPATASVTVADVPGFGAAGRTADLAGTGWSTIDLKGAWHTDAKNRRDAVHHLTFGVHGDRSTLRNPTFNTADWQTGGPLSVATQGDGKTRTYALWTQDVWRAADQWKFTVGSRLEAWRGYDGLNINGATTVRHREVSTQRFSPKGSVTWTPQAGWVATASLGRAYRFATAAELYQLVSTGITFTSPNPDLKPDAVVAAELKLERQFETGRARISFFQDEVRDAIIAQFNPLVPGSSQLFSYLSNLDHVRARGVELLLQKKDLLIRGFDVTGNATYLHARTIALSGRASATAAADAAIGKPLPNIPDWRAAFMLTYRPDQRWTFTVAGRYSGMLTTTLDAADVNPNTYQGFAAWFVADTRVHARLGRGWSGSVGVDNLLNRKYFLFHPFPHRTFITDVKFAF